MSSAMTSAIASEISSFTRDSRCCTAPSPVRSDSKTKRNSPLSEETNSIERRDSSDHPIGVVIGRGQGLLDDIDKSIAALVEERQVKVQLRGKVLVQDRFGYPSRVGDVVHGRRVVALGGEHFAGGIEQLDAALIPWQAGGPAAHRLLFQLRGHAFTLTCVS